MSMNLKPGYSKADRVGVVMSSWMQNIGQRDRTMHLNELWISILLRTEKLMTVGRPSYLRFLNQLTLDERAYKDTDTKEVRKRCHARAK